MRHSESRHRTKQSEPYAQHDEAVLIALAQSGDKQALGELYSRHVNLIYRYIHVRVKEPAVAEDLTAQVFLEALECLPRYRLTGAPFLAWLYRIACARVADYWRQRYRRGEVSLPATPAADCPDLALGLENEDNWVTALDLLAELSDDQQVVVIMRFVGEMKPAEIAKILGKTTGAVKAIQHRALASLARLLKEREN